MFRSESGHRLTTFSAADQPADDTLTIPEDLTTLSDEELQDLGSRAATAFQALYGDGETLSAEDLNTLTVLTEGLEALQAEQEVRVAAAAERGEQAAALAARLNPDAFTVEAVEDEPVTPADDTGEDEADEDEADEGAEGDDDEAADELAGQTRQTMSIDLSGINSRRRKAPAPVQETPAGPRMSDYAMAAPDVPHYANGAPMEIIDMAKAVDSRLKTFNLASYEAAANTGRHQRQQFGISVINKPFADGLRIESGDPGHVEEVLARAVDESRLPNGSLVASGGWCAPSQVIYDLCEPESRDGLLSVPEVAVTRGGVQHTKGPDFAQMFTEITGFRYTEVQDIAGNYGVDANGVGNNTEGNKPCYKVPCADFTNDRLDLDGVCVSAGLLQQRGYPELIARTVRGALVGHDHRMSARRIGQMVAGSTAVSMPADQVGATAPILTAIELQIEHMRDSRRLSRSASIEGVFPFWTRGLVRSDLSRRLGVDLLSVPDQRVNAWFAERGLNPQFVYNWQSLSSTAASGFNAWPSSISFMLYGAGTWVAGTSPVITLDTVYDSQTTQDNDYVALFTETGDMMMKRCHDSRVVTVPVCPTGETGGGVSIDCDGSEGS